MPDVEGDRQQRRARLGAFLRYLRDVSGTTQTELADALGVTDGAVSVWERGAADLRPDQLYALAQFYELSFSELLAAAGYDLSGGLSMAEWDARQRELRLQNPARPFGQKLRRSRLGARTPAAGDDITAIFATHRGALIGIGGRTPVLAHAASGGA